jgi:2-(1,2-epoxy-1,2-dihydrophenyl)acetyl-CoA isomerase
MSLLELRDDRGVLTLRLSRPEKRNAIDEETMLALIAAIEGVRTDDGVRVLLLEGEGEHFCGGADIIARNADSGSDQKPRVGSIQRRLPGQAHRLIPLLASIQIPVVCKVQGWAAGIGFQLALVADLTIAADDARFWEPFTERGFTPDSGATWMLPRRVGETRARELLLLGRALSGTEAAEWGAVYRSVPLVDLDRAVGELVDQLASGPTIALGLTKWLLNAGAAADLDAQLANEAFALELSSRTDDFREGMAAFREKRPPRFEGR